ncbi:uncharacterized protein LOC144743037 [Ciona intestinalis]
MPNMLKNACNYKLTEKLSCFVSRAFNVSEFLSGFLGIPRNILWPILSGNSRNIFKPKSAISPRKQSETVSFQWHQGYGYWYKAVILFHDLLSVMIAIHKCDCGNGYLK